MMADDYRRRGMSEEEARRTARLRFGGPTQTREDQHDRRGLPLVETALQDVRYALRTLRRNPGFTFVVILTLAVGIGAVTSMFTVVRAVLLRPLPYTQPDRLIEISETNPLKGWTHTVAAPANVADWRARNTVFTDIAGYIGVDNRGASQMQRFLSVNGEPQPVNGIATTGNPFDVLGVRLEPLHDIMAADARPTILMLFGAVAVLFLIVCANVASLQLGRGASRMREIAVRRALGAGRTRLVRQLLTEALLLSCLGAALGIALAAATPAILLRAAPSALPLFATPRIDFPVLLFAAALAIVAPVVFGLAPALSTSSVDRLAERAESGSRRTTVARDLLVVFEVGLSVVLVVGSVLLIRSLIHLQQVDPGFAPDRVVTFKVTLPRVKYPKDTDQVRVFADLERRLRNLPGVEAVGATSTLALRGYTWTGDASVEGRAADDYERELRHESVTPDYFAAMGTRLIAGRMLNEHDDARSNVTVVNEALARKYFPGKDAVGRRIKFGRPQDSDPWITIVGVVADAKQDGMDKPARPEVYVPFAANAQNPATFVVRSDVDATPMVAAARQAVRAIDRDLLLTEVTTLDGLVRDSMGDERFRTTLLSGFAGVALFLAVLGIYGVLAYFVSQRSRELGIRVALGARPRALFAMVVGQGMRPVAIGSAAGLAGAIALTGLMESLLFGVTPLDPITYASSIGVLAASALGAGALPALAAARVDPLIAIREE